MNLNLKFAEPVQWNQENEYNVNDVVFNDDNAYTAIDYVPSGTLLSNTSYWKKTGKFIRTQNLNNNAVETDKLADGAVTADKLSDDAFTKSGEGESVTIDNSSYLASLVVNGKAVQNGTPSLSVPAPIEVVKSRNLFSTPIAGYISGASDTFNQLSGLDGSGGTLFVAEIPSNTMFTVSAKLFTGMNRFRISLFDADPTDGSRFEIGHFSQLVNITNPTSDQTYTFSSGNFTWVVIGLSTSAVALNLDAQAQLETGSTATPYVAPGCIGLVVGDTATSIPLQGNVLASLPDGTRDVLTVDSTGHCVLTKKTYTAVFDGDDSWVYQSAGTRFNITPPVPYNTGNLTAFMCNQLVYISNTSAAGVDGIVLSGNGNIFISIDATHPEIDTTAKLNTYFASSPLVVIYQRKTPLQIDLGYIDMPAIADDTSISITAQVTPTITASWWTRSSAAIAEAVDDLNDSINSRVEPRIDDIASSIASVENGETSSTNYSENDFIMRFDKLYIVTSAIATGESFVVNTNIEEKTVIEAITIMIGNI